MSFLHPRYVVAIIGALVLTALLYLAPTVKKDSSALPVTAQEPSLQAILLEAKTHLPENDKKEIAQYEQQASDAFVLQLAHKWDSLKYPHLAAIYYEQLAQKTGTEKDWEKTAYGYFNGYRTGIDSITSVLSFRKAVESFEKVIAINPDNLGAKTNLGLCYTETSEPMKGITLLREVVAKDPRNINAHLILGLLSMRSGQYRKAVDRFKKILELDTTRRDVHMYLGEAYVQLQNRDSAIAEFQKTIEGVNDTFLYNQVNKYIAQLKDSSHMPVARE